MHNKLKNYWWNSTIFYSRIIDSDRTINNLLKLSKINVIEGCYINQNYAGLKDGRFVAVCLKVSDDNVSDNNVRNNKVSDDRVNYDMVNDNYNLIKFFLN